VSSVVQDYLESLPRTRKEAQEKGIRYYLTGKPCKKGHLTKRKVSNGGCVICNKEHTDRWREANPDKKREKDREYASAWSKANRHRRQEIWRRWAKSNPDKTNAKQARRRATKKNATPFWANQGEIKRFYATSKEFEQLTGIIHHVDHIYPLKSDFLCGLHVENNLQVLTAEKNIFKNNRSWPDQLPCQVGSGKDHAWWRELNERLQSPSTSGGRSL
jgi:hypothetical protein